MGPAPCGDEFGRGVASIQWCASARTPIQESADARDRTNRGAERGIQRAGRCGPALDRSGRGAVADRDVLAVTVRRDGRPHVTPLPAIWLDGALHFCAGSHEQKAKNLRANPGCVLAAGANQFRAGLDVVVEGPAVLVTDPARLQRLAALWKSELDWDFEVTDGGFRDPAGRLGLVFGVTPAKVLAFGKNPYSQTRYRFTS
jgi:general stress protein 26